MLLVSPILEYVLQRLDNKRIIVIWLVATFLNLYCCYYLEFTNSNGYSLTNFIYLYITGRAVRALIEENVIKTILYRYSFLIATVIAICMGMVWDYHNEITQTIESVKFWAYNSPWTIAISILIFIGFSRIEIQNSRINRIASCTLIVYLFHSNLVMHYYNKAITDYMTNYMGLLIGLFMASFVIYMLGTIVGLWVTKFHRYIINSIRKVFWVDYLFEYIPPFLNSNTNETTI